MAEGDVERFMAYAAAFEQAYASDDWSAIGELFHEDAVYEARVPEPLGGRFEGRDAILAYFPRVLDAFDRRFATRRVELLAGPELRDGAVWLSGRAHYTADGVPDLVFDLEETARFEGGRIRRLVDDYTPETVKAMEAWLDAHGDAVGVER